MNMFKRYDKENSNSIWSNIDKRRKAQVKDYTKLASGEVIYTGKYLYYTGTDSVEAQCKSIKVMALMLLCINIAMGFLRVPGMINTPWVILIYVFAFLTSIFVVKSSLSVKNPEKGLKEHVFLKTIDILPRRAITYVVFESALGLAYIVNLLTMIIDKNLEVSMKNGVLSFVSMVEKDAYFSGKYGDYSVLSMIVFMFLIIVGIIVSFKIKKNAQAQTWETK